MLVSALASCGVQDTPPPSDTTVADTSDTVASTTEAIVNWESANLPRKDFEGQEFVFLQPTVSNMKHAWHLLVPEEITGEVLNDAYIKRNRKIEEIYSTKITARYSDNVSNDAKNSINADDTSFTAAFCAVNSLYQMAREHYLQNYYDLEYIDPEAEWWDQSVVEGLSYNNTLYMLTGDISPAADTRTFVMVFNKDLCKELGLTMPYQAVRDGDWTLDLFKEYVSDVNHDVNGDSKMDFEDRWGFLSEDGITYMMYSAGGGRVVTKNKDGKLELTFNNERNVEIALNALEIAIDGSKTLKANPYAAANGHDWSIVSAWFAGGGALFRSTAFEAVPRDYRALDTNFGVVPFPKLDENQDRYYTPANTDASMLGVPVTADSEFAGLILESLAAESVSTVTPAYYDVCLDGKTVRDEESTEMLDIIFASKLYDVGIIVSVGGFRNAMNNLEASGDTNVASAYASMLSQAQAELDKLIEDLESTQ